jgi:hypothetical protein
LQRHFVDAPLDDFAVRSIMIQLHHRLVCLLCRSLPDQKARGFGKPLEGKRNEDSRNRRDGDRKPPGEGIVLCIGYVMRCVTDPGDPGKLNAQTCTLMRGSKLTMLKPGIPSGS